MKSRQTDKAAYDYDHRRTGSEIIAPTVHRNGTAGPVLIDQLETAVGALRAAESAVADSEPNGRDYQPQGPGKLGRAQAAHKRRLQALEEVRRELEAVWENVQEQIDNA